ncbi:MAG: hypothetical protein A2V98_04045 [Planctomycetes bacterium RBG_16_64_12]|nr:MAG: hypothetical protein A2V98_04045 [Planctomycetes bacterium RBG_16_64_12]
MQKYMVSHQLPSGLTREQICQVAEASQQGPEVLGYRSFINLSEGKAFCVLEADSREALAAWFDKLELPYDDIIPVEFEGERGVIEEVMALSTT